MRAVIQRVLSADVRIADKEWSSLDELPVNGKIGKGLMVLVGFVEDDTVEDLEWMARKVLSLRIFDDDNGVMNRSLVDVSGEMLVISQFTLLAATAKGNRPSYIRAARPEISSPLYDSFLDIVSRMLGKNAERGIFGADMKVSLVNDGPVTIVIDTKERNF